jgi:predicted RND superfamily exporter protein
MRSYFQFVTSHPIGVLAAAALLALGVGSFLLGITRDPDPDAFIPAGHPALARKHQVERDFGLKEPIVVAIFRDRPGGVFHPPTLRRIRELSRAIRELPRVGEDDVVSIATESGVYFEDGVPGFEPLMREIPETPEGLRALREDILGYELYRGTLVAADGSAACIIVRTEGDPEDDELYRDLQRLVDGFPFEDEWAVVAGEAAVRAHMGVAVSDDALRMNFVCPLVMALLIVLAYRTGRGTLLPLSVIGGSSALALGLMAAAGVPVFIVTNGIFVIIMALGVADSLHLIGQYYEEQLSPRGRSKQEIVVDSCMALWYPLLVTTLTDVVGFFALYLVGIMPPIRYFGLFTCVGVVGALLYSYTVVPAGLMILPLKMSRAFQHRRLATGGAAAAPSGGAAAVPSGAARTGGAVDDREGPSRGPGPSDPESLDAIGRFMAGVGRVVFFRTRPVLVLAGVIVVIAGWGASKLVLNDARILAFRGDHPLVRATGEINERFDGTSHLDVVVEASEERALLRPDMLGRIETLERYTETLPHVGGTHSLAGWVKRAHQKSNDEDPAFYVIPEDESDTEFYLDVLSARTSPMARLLLEVTDPTYTRANLIVRMTSSEFVHQREVVNRLQDYLDEHLDDETVKSHLAGRGDLDYHWLRTVRSSHVRSVVFSLFCVVFLTGLMFRSLLGGLLCGGTVGFAVLVNYAVMGLGDIPLGVGTSMFASIGIGAGVDFPIHILDRLRVSFRRGEADPAESFRTTLAFTGRALFFTAMIVTIGFLLLLVSEFRTLNRFGLLIGLGMAVSFLTSVTVLPAVVARLRPRFIWGPGGRPAPSARTIHE